MKNVLIPTDFSDNAWNALHYATLFFKKVKCNFYVLHVSSYETVNAALPLGTMVRWKPKRKSQPVKEQLQELLERIGTLPSNAKHRFFTIQEYMLLIDSIRNQVQEKNIDFIVMGTKGASGLKEMIIGSNTGDVITKVKSPILVVPEKARCNGIREIAFPTDYNIHYKHKILTTIFEVLDLTKASLGVLHVSKKEEHLSELQQKNKTYLAHMLVDKDYGFYFLSNPNLEIAVQCFVESREIDMITMVAKNLNFFQRILFHPTVEKISYHTSVPFLVLHE